jgi:hypothetical protein
MKTLTPINTNVTPEPVEGHTDPAAFVGGADGARTAAAQLAYPAPKPGVGSAYGTTSYQPATERGANELFGLTWQLIVIAAWTGLVSVISLVGYVVHHSFTVTNNTGAVINLVAVVCMVGLLMLKNWARIMLVVVMFLLAALTLFTIYGLVMLMTVSPTILELAHITRGSIIAQLIFDVFLFVTYVSVWRYLRNDHVVGLFN